MYKLSRWAFKLGQQTERHRIAGILNDHRKYHEVYHDPFNRRDEDKLSERKQRNLKVQREVDKRVNQIIEAIAEPKQREESRYSLLFPKEGK